MRWSPSLVVNGFLDSLPAMCFDYCSHPVVRSEQVLAAQRILKTWWSVWSILMGGKLYFPIFSMCVIHEAHCAIKPLPHHCIPTTSRLLVFKLMTAVCHLLWWGVFAIEAAFECLPELCDTKSKPRNPTQRRRNSKCKNDTRAGADLISSKFT